jgi:hypothetical protein
MVQSPVGDRLPVASALRGREVTPLPLTLWAHRSDSQHIHEAKVAATIEKLVSAGFGRMDAEGWVAAWELEAEARGLPRTDRDYWPAGETWIAMKRAQDRKPPKT